MTSPNRAYFGVKPAIFSMVVAALFAAGGAAAQTVYKSTMPDGKVVYGEKPVAGAAKVDKMDPPTAKTGVGGITPEERARAENLQRQRAQEAAASAKTQSSVEQARKQLQQAEAARDGGKEPLPSERSGMAGGGSRLNEAYFARQKALEEAVVAAQKALAAAQGR